MMEVLQHLLDAFQQSLPFFLFIVALFSLLVGSFLNVVIYRLPLMMEREWTHECQEFLAGKTPCTEVERGTESAETFNLSVPRSRCPACGHPISVLENIPILSYLWLRGKCAACNTAISLRYPSIELVTGLLSVFIAWQFGVTGQTLAALVLTWALICLTMIDYDKMLLPDEITLPLLWLGLLLNYFHLFTDLESAVVGAMLGYLSLWGVYHIFRILTKKHGMGYGDFKLLAVFGAWLGWQPILLIIILSSFVGAMVGICLVVFSNHNKNKPIPFGPYLAVAGWVALVFGDGIIHAYLNGW